MLLILYPTVSTESVIPASNVVTAVHWPVMLGTHEACNLVAHWITSPEKPFLFSVWRVQFINCPALLASGKWKALGFCIIVVIMHTHTVCWWGMCVFVWEGRAGTTDWTEVFIHSHAHKYTLLLFSALTMEGVRTLHTCKPHYQAPPLQCKYAGRAWYLFSCEHDVVSVRTLHTCTHTPVLTKTTLSYTHILSLSFSLPLI